MVAQNLKDKTVSGVFWSGVGRFGSIALNFLSNLVLARLLMPEDYGAIGMLYIFIALSNEFVQAGFGSALLQKKSPTEQDYTSVFWWNLVASLFFYCILFVCAPSIARFYAMPILARILRWQAVSTVILAFSLVPSLWLQKQFRFKELSMRQLTATAVGTIVGIALALARFGVWSLVASNLVGSLAGVLLLWRMSKWRPTLSVSFASLRELFRFGGLMALSSLLGTLYSNLQGLIMGRRYSASDLGYYTQAQKLENVPVQTLANVISQVTFPLFSEIQDERERLLLTVRKNVRMVCYLVFPAMALLAVIARPLILLLYGAKWEPAVPFFQLLCLWGMVNPLNAINVNVPKSLGRSDVFFFSHLFIRLIGIVMLLLASRKGVFGLVAVVVGMEYLFLLLFWIINKKLIGYGMKGQVRDMGFYYLLALVLAVFVYAGGNQLPFHPYVTMLLQIIVYAGLYVWVSSLLKLEGFAMSRELVREKLCRKKQ